MVTILLRYSKKSIFGFVLGYWYRAPKTQNFPVTGVRRVSLIIHCKPFSTLPEFILTRWLLEDGTWSSEEPTMWLESPKFQYPPLPFLGRGRSLSSMANDFINQAYLMQLIKTLSNDTQRAPIGAGQVAHVEKAWKLMSLSPILPYAPLPSVCSWVLLLITRWERFPEFWEVTENYWTWERSCGNPWFI